MHIFRKSLDTLPVELLYEIQFYAASEVLPLTCKRVYHVFKSAPPSIHAEYILGRYQLYPYRKRCLITQALRYPICCSEDVVEALLRRPDCPSLTEPGKSSPELPRHLFRDLKTPGGGVWKDRHKPLPFLKYIYNHPRIPRPDPNSHKGYPLICAIFSGSMPLLHFLLDQGANPSMNGAFAVHAAIRKKDLSLVKLLIERPSTSAGVRKSSAKRRRLPDRVGVTPEMLKVAVRCGAADIANYFITEKCVVPDMETVRLL